MSQRVLMIFPDLPAAVGTGGQVRAWHFLNEISKSNSVLACVLPERSNGLVNISAFSGNVKILQSSTKTPTSKHRGLLQRLLGPFNVFLSPSTDNGARLLITGRANNVDRARNFKGQSFTLLHRIYGWMLRAYADRMIPSLEPFGCILRRNSWNSLIPSIEEHYHQTNPEVIWIEHSFLFPLAAELRIRFPKARVVCNAHNVESALHATIAAGTTSRFARRWIELEGRIIAHWERRMLRESDTVFCCSDSDAVRFRTTTTDHQATIQVVPNGVDTEYFERAAPSPGIHNLLFAGTGGYAPNDDAVDWLTGEIFPKVLSKLPDCQLILAGRDAEKCWGHVSNRSVNLSIQSDIPDMRPLLANASVCLVPLRSGSGTRLKILEAMSSGRAIVSTTIGAEGIHGVDGTHWLLADSADEFTARIIDLLLDLDLRHHIESSGRSLATEHYSWQALTKGLGDRLNR